MGVFDDLFGSSSNKPRVTEKEYIKAKSEMYTQDFTDTERKKVDEIFAPQFSAEPTLSHPRGLTEKDIDARIKWMRGHKSEHGFSDHRIDQIEADLKKRL